MSRAYKKLTGVKVGDIKEEQKGNKQWRKTTVKHRKEKKKGQSKRVTFRIVHQQENSRTG